MEELICREGTVHSVIFQNAENGYTVLRLLTEEGEAVTVVGCVPCAAPGEHLTVTGVWERHPQHGEQLRAAELERSLPEDEEEMFSYLSSGVLKGVGPATARNIVERFGAETFDILETAPERLATVKGITARRAQEIAGEFRQHMGLRRLMAFLARYELPPVLAMRLRRQYGDAALEKLREDPYLLSADDCGVAFSVADQIAMSMGFEPDSGLRLQAAVSFELSHNENNGHVFLPGGNSLPPRPSFWSAAWTSRSWPWTGSSARGWSSRNGWPMWTPATSGGCGRRKPPPRSAWRPFWRRSPRAGFPPPGRWTSWSGTRASPTPPSSGRPWSWRRGKMC